MLSNECNSLTLHASLQLAIMANQTIWEDGPILLAERQQRMLEVGITLLTSKQFVYQIKWRFGYLRSQITKYNLSHAVNMKTRIQWSIALDNHNKGILWPTTPCYQYFFLLLCWLERPISTIPNLHDES